MYEKLSVFLAGDINLDGDIDWVFAFPIIVVTLVAIARLANLMRWALRDTVYIAWCLTLAIAYCIPFMRGWNDVAPFIRLNLFWVPQVIPLALMAGIALVKRMRNPDYRSPSLWWAAAVTVAGHLWTMFWFAALAAKIHPAK